jgi:acyl-CoA reductase-like NAD-dependent aldehyde dehydrogenase
MDWTPKLLIDGALVDGEGRLPVVNPATGEAFIEAPRASREQAAAAVAAAKKPQPAWAALPLARRAACLVQLADAIEAPAEEIARMMVMEQGKPLAEASGEVAFAVHFVRYFAAQELPAKLIRDDEAYRIELYQKPLGVVVGITPWNFPFLIPAFTLAPAVVLGNSFILKPAPTTPLVALILGEIAASIFPAGVVNVIVDDSNLGPMLTEHPDVAKVSFTGSTQTGRRIMASASSSLKRLTLELGGNDATIVLDDADVEKTAHGIANSAFMNSRQVCIAVKRLYVHDSLYDQMCDALARIAGDLPIGNGLEQGTRIGPTQNKAQFEKAKGYLAAARRDGKIVVGGNVLDGPGYFVEPTVVRDISDGSALDDEEQFSPILPVFRFTDVDEVIERANASEHAWADRCGRRTSSARRRLPIGSRAAQCGSTTPRISVRTCRVQVRSSRALARNSERKVSPSLPRQR